MTYTELVQAIKDYTENTEATFVSQIPTFVRNAEKRIYLASRLPFFRKRQVATLPAGTQYFVFPTDYLSSYSLSVIVSGETYFMEEKDFEFVRIAFPTSTQGTPRVYAVEREDRFIIGPPPAGNYQFELSYFFYPASIVDEDTTWLGDNFDQVLLYGALLEAYTFMKGETDMMAQYTKLYNDSLAQMQQFARSDAAIDLLKNPPTGA